MIPIVLLFHRGDRRFEAYSAHDLIPYPLLNQERGLLRYPDVHAIILLESSQDKITKEWMFYNADFLISCGWAQ